MAAVKLEATRIHAAAQHERDQMIAAAAQMNAISTDKIEALKAEASQLNAKATLRREEVMSAQSHALQQDIGITVLRSYLEETLKNENDTMVEVECHISHFQAEHQHGLAEVSSTWIAECETLDSSRKVSAAILESQSARYLQLGEECVDEAHAERTEQLRQQRDGLRKEYSRELASEHASAERRINDVRLTAADRIAENNARIDELIAKYQSKSEEHEILVGKNLPNVIEKLRAELVDLRDSEESQAR